MSEEGTLRRLDDGFEVAFERVLDHPVERVWARIAEPEGIGTWYVRTELEPLPGGRIVEHHDHVGMSMAGEVTRYDPPRRFDHTWWADPAGERIMGSIAWRLGEADGGTRLSMANRVHHAEGAFRTMAGWHICLDVLAAVLDGDDPGAHAPPRGVFRDGRFEATAPGRGRWADRERLEERYARVEASAP